jgi:hypothetical protein
MPSSGIIRRVALVRTEVSGELSAYIISVTRIGELGTLAVTSNRSVLRRVTRRNIPEDGILHSHRRENLKSYTSMLDYTTVSVLLLFVHNRPECVFLSCQQIISLSLSKNFYAKTSKNNPALCIENNF